MNDFQKMGGIAALYEAAAYVVGMVGFLLVVDVSGVADPVQQVALMADNQAFLSILHLIVYVIWGVFMVVLALALHERLKAGSPAMAQTASRLWVDLGWPGHCQRHALQRRHGYSRRSLQQRSGSSCDRLVGN